METDRLTRLSERERAYLRLVGRGMSSKEIALEYGVQPGTVDSGLKSAMAKLGTSSRRSAARILVASEAQKLAPQPQPLEQPLGPAMIAPSGLDRDWSSVPAPERRLREERVPYEASFYEAHGLRLPISRYWGDKNDLTLKTRLLWIGAISLAAVLLASALVAISWGAVRVAGQIFRAMS